MADRSFSDEELLDYARGDASDALAARIEAAAAQDQMLQAEIAVLQSFKPALAIDDMQPPGELGWKRLEASINAEATPARSTSLWRIAATVLGLAVLGQGAYIATQMPGNPDQFRPVAEVAEAHVLGVVFEDTTTMADLAALLSAAEARIIDGPSAIGLYRLAFVSAEAREAARETLATSSFVSLIAEE